MAQPTPFNRSADYSEYQTANPSAPFNGANLDSEMDDIETTLDETLSNLSLIQRDDGKLANESVHLDALSAAVLAFISAVDPDKIKGAWVTATAYSIGDVVSNSGVAYVCTIAHTSGTFSTDVNDNKFSAIGSASTDADQISFTPAGGVAATDVQAAIEEVDSEKLSKASNLSDLASASTSRTNLSVASTTELQTNTFTYFADSGSADAMAITPTPALSGYANGVSFIVKKGSSANATTAPGLNVSSQGNKVCYYPDGSALTIGDLAGNGIYVFVYNSSFNSGSGGFGVYGIKSPGLYLTNTITPSEITSNQNNYSPTGYETAQVYRLSSDALRIITGFGGGTAGRVITVLNVGSNDIVLANESASSSAANRMAMVNSLIVESGEACVFLYDGTSSRWRRISGSQRRVTATAWVTFNGTSGTITPANSYNVTSITDNGTGDYTINFENTFASVDYAALVTVKYIQGTEIRTAGIHTKGLSSLRIQTAAADGSALTDSSEVCVVCFGGQ